MTRKFYVYVHRKATDGTIFYVGKGSGRRHDDIKCRNQRWNRVVKKYGFTSHIIFRFSNEECAFSFEVALIRKIGIQNLCNMTSGGEGVCNPTQEVRQKMSIAKKGKPPAYLLDVEKAKAAAVKISAIISKPIVTDRGETFRNGVEAIEFLRGHGFPTASRGNIASCITGKQRTAYGRTWSREGSSPPSYSDTCYKKSNMKSKPVVRSDGVEFDSAAHAARSISHEIGVYPSQGNISMVCRGERKIAYGYGWSYK